MSGGQVFVSYSRHDRAYAARLVAFLRTEGFEVFWDDDLPHGSRWHAELMARLRSASAFVVVMSPEADASDNVHNEVGNALDTEGLPVLPLLLRGKRFDRLSEIHYDDVTSGDLPDDDFLASLRAGLGSAHAQASELDEQAYGRRSGFDDSTADYRRHITSPETERAAAITAEARGLMQRFRFPEAMTKIEEALDVASDFVPALVNRATLHGQQGDYRAALADADRAVAIDPEEPFAHGCRAFALIGLRRLAEGRTALERTLALDPDNVATHWALGGVHADLGEFDEAIACYDRALVLSPDIKQLQLARKMATARKWAARIGIGRRPRSR